MQRFLESERRGITPPVKAVAVCLGVLNALCSPLNCFAAVGSPTPVDPPAELSSPITPHAPDPQRLDQVLQSTDASEAARVLWQSGCGPAHAAWTQAVERAWDRRDAGAPGAATRDPVVRAVMAKCLAERWSRFYSPQPNDLPIIAELRHAVLSANSEEVRAAAEGLTHFATAEDVRAMVAVPSRFPSLLRTTVGALSEVCRADAASGIARIRESVADTGERAEIDRIAKGMAPTRRLVCRFDVNIVGNPISAADIEDFWVPRHVVGEAGSAREIGDLLNSSKVESARKALWELRCLPSEKTSIDAVLSAWRTRDSAPPESVTRDAKVRVNMAVCLAEASAASHTEADPSVAAELRKSVKSDDAHFRIEGMEALSRIATATDIGMIVEAAKEGPAILAHIAAADLRTSCVPGAAEAAETLREWTTSERVRDQIDFEIKSTERVREAICIKNVHEAGGR